MTKRKARRGRPANPMAKRRQTTRAGQGRNEPAVLPETLLRRIAGASSRQAESYADAIAALHMADDVDDPALRGEVRKSAADVIARAEALAKDARAGTALGRLLLRGVISEAEWEAGEAFGRLARLHQRLLRPLDSPDPTPRAVPLPYKTDNEPDAPTGLDATMASLARETLDEDLWERVGAAYVSLTRLLLRQGVAVYSLVYGVCVEDDVPDQFLRSPAHVVNLRTGLAVVASARGIPLVAEAG
ncbi:MAG: hypothetical protein LDL44_00560 [Caenispirillum sp.]|nr:hypothetical protein [Caenispirillum sp.]